MIHFKYWRCTASTHTSIRGEVIYSWSWFTFLQTPRCHTHWHHHHEQWRPHEQNDQNVAQVNCANNVLLKVCGKVRTKWMWPNDHWWMQIFLLRIQWFSKLSANLQIFIGYYNIKYEHHKINLRCGFTFLENLIMNTLFFIVAKRRFRN